MNEGSEGGTVTAAQNSHTPQSCLQFATVLCASYEITATAVVSFITTFKFNNRFALIVVYLSLLCGAKCLK